MADSTFTELPSTSSALLTDIMGVDQGSLTVKLTLQQVFKLFLANNILYYAGDPNGNVAGTSYQGCWDTVNDALYICTQTGTTLTAVWKLSSGISLPLSLTNGGTNKSLTASNGGLVYSDADSLEILAGTATAGQIPRSSANSAPSWSTATFASTYDASNLLYSNGANTVQGLATANRAQLVTNATGVPSFTSSLTNGQIIIGSTAGTPAPATLTAGANVSITNGSNSITISASATGLGGWEEVSSAYKVMVSNTGYVINYGFTCTLELPATPSFGDLITIVGTDSAGLWKILQTHAGDQIIIGNTATTVGVTGFVQSIHGRDTISLICVNSSGVWASINAPLSSGLTLN
jgi:hypothetical protein